MPCLKPARNFDAFVEGEMGGTFIACFLWMEATSGEGCCFKLGWTCLGQRRSPCITLPQCGLRGGARSCQESNIPPLLGARTSESYGQPSLAFKRKSIQHSQIHQPLRGLHSCIVYTMKQNSMPVSHIANTEILQGLSPMFSLPCSLTNIYSVWQIKCQKKQAKHKVLMPKIEHPLWCAASHILPFCEQPFHPGLCDTPFSGGV